MSRIVLLICLWCTFLAHAQTWNTSGNAGTNSAINFIGTTDSQSLVMKTNNSERIKILSTGRVVFNANDGGYGWTDNLFFGGGSDFSTGLGNTVIGIGSLVNNASGQYNTALGSNALRTNIGGQFNVAIGPNAMMNNLNGSRNIGIGENSVGGNKSGNNNTAVGQSTLSMAEYANGNTILGTDVLRYLNSGDNNVVIGNQAYRELQTGSNNISIGYNNLRNKLSGSENIYIGSNIQSSSANPINELNIGNWIIGNNGTIGIGSFTNPIPADGIAQDGQKYKLFVKDGIKTEKIKVDIASINGWADYVFEKDYYLMSLKDLKKFIDENHHLPEIPTAEEVVQNGVELKEMTVLLLKKIEELSLHVIQLNEKIEHQEKIIKALNSQ